MAIIRKTRMVCVAAVIVAAEVLVLAARIRRAYRYETAKADLVAAIDKCDPAEVQDALSRGADAVHDMKPKRSIWQVGVDTLSAKHDDSLSLFNSKPLSLALAVKPTSGVQTEVWRSKRLEIVRMLLDHGANPNQKPGYDYSPLYVAICANDADMTKALLDHGADANADAVPNAPGMKSPVLLAAACRNLCSNPAIANLLLDHGADVNAVGSSGKSALMEATQLDDVPMVNLLMHRNARPDLKDHGGHTAIDFAGVQAIPAGDKARLLRLISPGTSLPGR